MTAFWIFFSKNCDQIVRAFALPKCGNCFLTCSLSFNTLVLLSIDKFESRESLNWDLLKASYKAFLASLQPNIPRSNSLEIDFVDDITKCRELANCFNVHLATEGIDRLISHDEAVKNPISKVKTHLEILRKTDSYLYSIFNLAVNSIFCGDSEHAVGGTTSAAIGVVWGNPTKEWKICDYLEYFIHELTHTLMFLDELRFLHYKNLEIMYEKENFSLSAILQAERPIDRVLHSIVVATEVLLFRFRNLVDHAECQIHPGTDQLIESTQVSIERLLAHPNRDKILTSRALEIIEICQNSLAHQTTLCLVHS